MASQRLSEDDPEVIDSEDSDATHVMGGTVEEEEVLQVRVCLLALQAKVPMNRWTRALVDDIGDTIIEATSLLSVIDPFIETPEDTMQPNLVARMNDLHRKYNILKEEVCNIADEPARKVLKRTPTEPKDNDDAEETANSSENRHI